MRKTMAGRKASHDFHRRRHGRHLGHIHFRWAWRYSQGDYGKVTTVPKAGRCAV